MRRAVFALVVLAACHHAPARQPDVLTVAQVAQLLDTHAATPCDANVDTVRARQGVVPGAVLLSDYGTYALSELPADRATELVFYCANEQCGASELAARRALDHGYAHVAVMPAGIAGWRQAGRATTKL